MKFTPTSIDGAWLIDLEPLADDRGDFARLYCRETFLQHGVDLPVPQANLAVNTARGTLRGMHYQAAPHEEGKLIHCTGGSVYDVLADLRPGSPTRGRWFGVELSAENRRAVYGPPGCAHGYISLTDRAVMLYLMGRAYVPSAARGVRWNDPRLAIDWPMQPLLVSDRDRAWPDWAG
jgi:dTDP-4-dehydrorhamnose 3,5-epimerase